MEKCKFWEKNGNGSFGHYFDDIIFEIEVGIGFEPSWKMAGQKQAFILYI